MADLHLVQGRSTGAAPQFLAVVRRSPSFCRLPPWATPISQPAPPVRRSMNDLLIVPPGCGFFLHLNILGHSSQSYCLQKV